MNIEEIITKQRICILEESCSKDIAIEKMIDSLVSDQVIDDKKQFRKDIEKREQEFCTYVGHETAIPHAISETVKSAGIAFLKSKEPFLYGEENEDVRLMFMLAIPKHSNTEHLRMLSMLATHLMHQNFRDALLKAQDKEEVYQVLCSIS